MTLSFWHILPSARQTFTTSRTPEFILRGGAAERSNINHYCFLIFCAFKPLFLETSSLSPGVRLISPPNADRIGGRCREKDMSILALNAMGNQKPHTLNSRRQVPHDKNTRTVDSLCNATVRTQQRIENSRFPVIKVSQQHYDGPSADGLRTNTPRAACDDAWNDICRCVAGGPRALFLVCCSQCCAFRPLVYVQEPHTSPCGERECFGILGGGVRQRGSGDRER